MALTEEADVNRRRKRRVRCRTAGEKTEGECQAAWVTAKEEVGSGSSLDILGMEAVHSIDGL